MPKSRSQRVGRREHSDWLLQSVGLHIGFKASGTLVGCAALQQLGLDRQVSDRPIEEEPIRKSWRAFPSNPDRAMRRPYNFMNSRRPLPTSPSHSLHPPFPFGCPMGHRSFEKHLARRWLGSVRIAHSVAKANQSTSRVVLLITLALALHNCIFMWDDQTSPCQHFQLRLARAASGEDTDE